MGFSDPVADLLTRIRNASKAKYRYVDVPWSKLKENIVKLLQDQGFVSNFVLKKESEQRGTLRIFLKYDERYRPIINGLKRISRPGLRKYVGHSQIPIFFGGAGVPIISTSQGVMDGNQARKKKVGGELLCLVW